jgi:DNA-binding Lrp family transcriptional regulator
MTETKPKPRKQKLELREPAKPLSDKPLDPNHPAALIYAEVKRAEQNRLEDSASLENIASQEDSASLANITTPARKISSLAESSSLANSASQMAQPQPDLTASLPQVKGYLRLHHQLIDHLLPQLQPAEAIVYLQLYRLSWGFKNSSCLISYLGIANRCGMSSRTVQDVTARLVGKGLIEKINTVMGAGKVQGIEWRVVIPASLEEFARLEKSANIKDKDLKEINKREMAPPDYKNCPDCQGSGFWYPEGIERGVAKCKHVRLTEGK